MNALGLRSLGKRESASSACLYGKGGWLRKGAVGGLVGKRLYLVNRTKSVQHKPSQNRSWV